MIPAGYIFKKIAGRPDWLVGAPQVCDLYSVSGCISKDFCDFVPYWRHNSHWFFDEPAIMAEIARETGLDLGPMTLFYYEIFEHEFTELDKVWAPFEITNFVTEVKSPATRTLCGFDVATYSNRNSPECSPLSCNGLAAEIPTNEHCLFETFEEAKVALDAGRFDNSEPGPFRILAVYRID